MQQLFKYCRAILEGLQVHQRAAHILPNPPKSEKIAYPAFVKENLLSGLRKQSHCASCPEPNRGGDNIRWHPTRLLLTQKPLEDDVRTVSFNALIAGIPQERWQDIGLNIPRYDSFLIDHHYIYTSIIVILTEGLALQVKIHSPVNRYQV